MSAPLSYTLAVIAVCALCTFGERMLPFLIFRKGDVPGVVRYLGRVLPLAVMAALTMYCLRGVRLTSLAGFAPQLLASTVTAGLHLWKRSTLLSVAGGTACYMLLVQLVF